MDRLAELLSSWNEDLSALTAEDLAGWREELAAAARETRDRELNAQTAGAIATAAELAQAIDTENSKRAAFAAEYAAAADAALALFDGGGAPGALAASGAQARRQVKVPARHQPRLPRSRGPRLLRGDGSGGGEFVSFDDAVEGLTPLLENNRNASSQMREGERRMAMQFDWSHCYPEERQLRGQDLASTSEKMRRYVEHTETLVASGGVPGPAEPRYEQITYGQANRPLRDALPTLLASRGEIIYNQSPTLGEILVDTGAGAIGEVTSAQDASGTTKNIQTISAPTPATAVVGAETLRFEHGNFADRFYPERTRAFMALGQVAYARHNDSRRLLDIKNGSTKWTDTPAKFGAYRDLKRQFLGVTEEIEDLVRDFNQSLTVLMPEYAPALLAADLIAQGAGDASFNMTEERMRADMRSWDQNVNFVFISDSVRGALSTVPSGQSPRTPGFDADVEWAIFPTGAWLFLDGGSLDLGIIRDSVTSSTNKFQTFFESWEAVAQLVSLSWWITSSLCSSGTAQAPQNIAVCSPQNS